jgi:V/A-type H+-transporting ATPase subunit D
MSQINVAPTRSNLIRVKKELEFAREGYEILDKKREVLTSELMHLAHDAEVLQQKVWESLDVAYRSLENARLTVGQEHVEWVSMAVNKSVEVDIKARSIMGVAIPMIEHRTQPRQISYSLGNVPATLDNASYDFEKFLRQVPELAEMTTSAWRLARELRKTKRRVNALKHIFIPAYEETVAYIESTLEEREREETFRLKLLKSKSESSEGQDEVVEESKG